jgi:hypothetical protein
VKISVSQILDICKRKRRGRRKRWRRRRRGKTVIW